MTEGSSKYEVLAAAGKRAAEMQPDTIRLIEAPGYSWKESVQKAYLADVRYDEIPNAAVTLCLFATDPVTLPLVKAIKQTYSELDLLLVRAPLLSKLEAVCLPFYIYARW